jgi:4-amino-4-deoxy-L-arabinose transferase-like glycosyltransferase
MGMGEEVKVNMGCPNLPAKARTPVEIWIFSIILIFFLIRLFIINHLELSPDEAYYWYWSKHPDLSYSDHPPMVAYIMTIFTALGGDTEFFVRLGGLICSAMALILLYLTSITLFPANRLLAWEILFLFNITLLFPAGCIVQTPDTPMLLFWTAAVFCGSRIITGGPAWWWYLWGASLGLGLLSKYTMILIVPCMVLFFLLSPAYRHWFFKKEPYLALVIALFLFSPVILWNWQHHWISFAYQLQQGFTPKKREALEILSKLLEYLGGQAGVITPLLFIAFMIYSIKGILVFIHKGVSAYLYLVLLSWPILLFFGLATALGKVAEANWPAPAYIAGFILMCHVFHEFFRKRGGHRKFLYAGIGFALIVNIVVHVHLVYPFIPIPPNIDPTNQFHCWRDLGKRMNTYIHENPREGGYFLLADKGTTVAEAVFYSGNRFTGLDFAHPERYIFLKDLEKLRGKDAIIVLHNQSEEAVRQYHPYFEAFERIGAHACIYRCEKIDALCLQLVAGKSYRGNWLPFGAPKDSIP